MDITPQVAMDTNSAQATASWHISGGSAETVEPVAAAAGLGQEDGSVTWQGDPYVETGLCYKLADRAGLRLKFASLPPVGQWPP